MRQLRPLLVITLSILITLLIYKNKPETKHKTPAKKTLSVETIEIKPQQFPIVIHTQGTVEPRTSTTLISRVSGEITAVSSNFRPGGFFKKGENLLTIDPTDYLLDIKLAEAAVAEAYFTYEQEQAQAKQAGIDWKKIHPKVKPSDLVLHKPQLAREKAALESAKAQLQRSQLDLKRTKIKAPYAGRILEQFVDIGQYLSPGNDLVKIFSIDYVEIRIPITEKQREMINLSEYDLNQNKITKDEQQPSAKIFSSTKGNKFSWTGRVVRTEGSIDRTTRQVFLIVQVDNPYQHQSNNSPPLEIGQFVKIEIQGKVLENAYSLPRSAVQGNNTIMIVDKESRLQRKAIEVVWETRDQLLIQDGLATGEKLCVTYVPFAANNTKVDLIGDHKNKSGLTTNNE